MEAPACCRREAAVPTVSTKQCYGCGVVRPAEWFSAGRGSTKLHSRCKPCQAHDIQQRSERLQRERATREPLTEKKCPVCENTLPVTSFSSAPQSTDGMYSICRSCDHTTGLARKRERTLRLREHPSMAPQPKERICSACKETKSRSEFPRDRSAMYGMYAICKECRKQSHPLSRK